jgi:hypothetical protein
MSQATTTRKQLRLHIAKALQMKFFQLYEDGYIPVTTTALGNMIISTSLAQEENYWKGGWALLTRASDGSQSIRKITSYNYGSSTIFVDRAFDPAPAAGDQVEIYDTFSPMLIHEAINDAISYAGRYFPKSVEDHTLTLGLSDTWDEQATCYNLTGLAEKIWRLNAIRVSTDVVARSFTARTRPSSDLPFEWDETKGEVYLPLSFNILDDQFIGWTVEYTLANGTKISAPITDTVAYLTGNSFTNVISYAKELEDTYSVGGEAVTIRTSTNLDIELSKTFRVISFRLDTPEYPSYLWIEEPPISLLGHMLILDYETIPTELTSDLITTTIPEKFILHHAQMYLHESMMNDNRSDMARHERLAGYHKQKADEYELKFPLRRPASSQMFDSYEQRANDISDPLGWKG